MIEVKILLNDELEASGIYDPGSRITIINKKLLHVKNDDGKFSSNLKTINGRGKTDGIIKLKAKILGKESFLNAFIYENENFDYDLILGLDTIERFGLTHDGNLNIQNQEKNNINKTEEDLLQKDNKEKRKKIQNGKSEEINSTDPTKKNEYHIINDHDNKTNMKEPEIKNAFAEYEINFNEGIDTNRVNMDTEHLDSHKREQIDELLKKYRHIFAQHKFDVGRVKNYEAFIDLQVDQYCYKRPYRCSVADKIEIEKQISELLKYNLIEESYSPFAAPVTLAFKRDEGKKSRLCIDFRDLNKIIVPQFQPFPLIEDLMVETIDCKFFTTLDINSAFWSIPLRIRDRPKTGFVTQDGHYQWTCLPFGLKTSPAIFQRILRNIIRKYN